VTRNYKKKDQTLIGPIITILTASGMGKPTCLTFYVQSKSLRHVHTTTPFIYVTTSRYDQTSQTSVVLVLFSSTLLFSRPGALPTSPGTILDVQRTLERSLDDQFQPCPALASLFPPISTLLLPSDLSPAPENMASGTSFVYYTVSRTPFFICLSVVRPSALVVFH
jgi:hypothetical protein